jgi:nucleoid DNA-binding protein
MTKAELIARIASRKDLPRNLTKRAYGRIVDAVFTEVGDYFIRARPSLSNPPRLSYPGFGTFTKRRRSSRVVRNPATGTPITIPAQCTVVFMPGQELKNLINRVPVRRTSSAA